MQSKELANNPYFFVFMMNTNNPHWGTKFYYDNVIEKFVVKKIFNSDEESEISENNVDKVFEDLNIAGKEEFIKFFLKMCQTLEKKYSKSLRIIELVLDHALQPQPNYSPISFYLNFNNHIYKTQFFIKCSVIFSFGKMFNFSSDSTREFDINLHDMDMRSRVAFSSVVRFYYQKFVDEEHGKDFEGSIKLIEEAISEKFVEIEADYLQIPRFLISEYLNKMGYSDLIIIEFFAPLTRRLQNAEFAIEVNTDSVLYAHNIDEFAFKNFKIFFMKDSNNNIDMVIDPKNLKRIQDSRVVYSEKAFSSYQDVKNRIQYAVSLFEKRVKTMDKDVKEQIIQLLEDFFMKI